MLDIDARPFDFGDSPQRMAALVGLPDVLAESGVAVSDVLAELPLDPSVFDSDENRIPYGLATRLLENAARLTGRADLGLVLGSRFDHRCMGAAGQWMQNAPTLEAALTGFIALQSTATRGATAFLHKHADHVIFGYGAYDRTALGHTQVYSVVISMAANIVRTLTGGQVRPVEVLLSFRKPIDQRPYVDFFGVPVRFDQPLSGLVLSFTGLRARIQGANPIDFAQLQERAASLMPPGDKIWSGRVRRLLRTSLLRGEVTAAESAGRLRVHPRALSRHLAAEGTRFQEVLDEVRSGSAKELLAVTDLSIGDIALAIGYTNHAAFDYAFRRWSGMTPSDWRKTWLSRQTTGGECLVSSRDRQRKA